MAYSIGQIITMNLDGTDRDYRILKLNGSIAEVVCMSTVKTIGFNMSNNTYAGSTLDSYLNSTWYNTLTDKAKAAIVSKTLNQDSWYSDASGSPVYNGHYGPAVPATSSYSISKGSSTYGDQITRNVYALSLQDMIDYITNTDVGDGLLENYNIWKMFWDTTVKPSVSEQLWLCSASATSTRSAWIVNTNNYGYVSPGTAGIAKAVRPALTIDLSKIFQIGYSITYHADGGTPEPENLTGQTTLPSPLPTVSKANFSFDGWYTDSTFQTPAVAGAAISADTDLYAKFTRSHITLDLSIIGLSEGIHSIQVKLSDDDLTKWDSELSNTVQYTVEPEPQGETWVINETPIEDTMLYINQSIDFVSNNTQYSTIEIVTIQGCDIRYNSTSVYHFSWSNQAYRTVTFETAPTGNLLTWLQANATKQ